MSVRLLITPHPFEDESFEGYILRVSDRNGYPSPDWLKRAIGSKRLYDLSKTHRTRLARAFNQPPEKIEQMIHLPAANLKKHVSFGNRLIHRSSIENKVSRYCPDCVREQSYFREHWELRAINTCPTHKSFLIDKCPHCSGLLHWNRERLTFCPCGHDLCDATSLPADDASIGLSRDIKLVLDGKNKSCLFNTLPPAFYSIGLGLLLDQLTLLAAYVSGKGRGRGVQLASRLLSDANRDVYTRVAGLLIDWPNNFYRLLDDIRRPSDENPTKTGLANDFKSLYAALYSYSDKDKSPARDAFQCYVRSHWTGGYISRKNTYMSALLELTTCRVPLARAATQIGVHPSILRRDIVAGRLPAIQNKAGKVMLTLIDTHDLERYRNARGELIGLSKACDLLGLSKKPVFDLVAEGLLKASRGPTIDGHHLWLFHKPEIRAFLKKVSNRNISRSTTRHLIGFPEALRRMTFLSLNVVDLVNAMQSGKISARRSGKKLIGFKSLKFDLDEFGAFISEVRRTIEWAISIESAAKKLKLNEQAARDLVRLGYLKTTNDFSAGRNRRLVSFTSIEEFKQIYVSASELAVRMKTSARNAVMEMKKIGILAVTGPSIDGGRQYFFLRIQVQNVMKTAA